MPRQRAERKRLAAHRAHKANWRHWGPYLSDRAWGTVREDYSPNGDAWNYFPFDDSHRRTYRWGEDGIGGICDRNQYLCFSWALWNGQDPFLKERFFGLTQDQGPHGEDCKECYWHLDGLPTHSFMRMLYRYPQKSYPYEDLIRSNQERGFSDPEYELVDTGIFAEERFFDCFIEYAKADQEDLLIQLVIVNRGPDAAPYWVLPHAWFRNTWSWGYKAGPAHDVNGKPRLWLGEIRGPVSLLELDHPSLGRYTLFIENSSHLLFTENETNWQAINGTENESPYTKDAFHEYVVRNNKLAVNPDLYGTKAAALFHGSLNSQDEVTIRLRLCKTDQAPRQPFQDFDGIWEERKLEADAFYDEIQHPRLTRDMRMIQRSAFAGLLWSKQLYYYDVEQWLAGDPKGPTPPPERLQGRNHDWENLVNFDVISMPDAWEYPWYASWDLAFHCLPLSIIDPDFAKRQLILMTREWYMHTNGQLPAYEWSFSDVNPPVHAWATWRVYKIDGHTYGHLDRPFLEGIFHKLLLNFTWWVNRKDALGNNIFQGGFLGMDNISVFDRSAPLPLGGYLDQSDGTAWMGFYCVLMMKIALALAEENPVYQDCATKFFEHFLRIAGAMTRRAGGGPSLWDPEDGFFYDRLHLPDGSSQSLRVRSLVGLLPLLAVETIDPELFSAMPIFRRRVEWFIEKHPDVLYNIECMHQTGEQGRRLVSFLNRECLVQVLRYMLDENEFLSPHGVRSISRYHLEHPYSYELGGTTYSVNYEPGESETALFGGNSNWRGPVWFPVNFLLIEALQKYHHYFGDSFKVECPTGSGQFRNLWEVSVLLSRRLIRLFTRNESGQRPFIGPNALCQTHPHWRDRILFHEYYHGETGQGLGASHQTGWTGLVAKLIQQSGLHSEEAEADLLIREAHPFL